MLRWWLCDEHEAILDLLEKGANVATSNWQILRVEDCDTWHLLVDQI